MTEGQALHVRALAEAGFSYRLICRKVFRSPVTGSLSYQIAKVLRSYGIKIRDYRNGTTAYAKGVVADCMKAK